MKQLYTLLESPTYLQFPDLYKSFGIMETRFTSARQFNKAIAKTAPDIMLAEFIYGYGNNYAGINVSNLRSGPQNQDSGISVFSVKFSFK